MEQFTKEQAKIFFDSGVWKDWTDEQIFSLQSNQKLLCVPFSRFNEAIEGVLGRPVWTHEIALDWEDIKKEAAGRREQPTMDEILNLTLNFQSN